MYRTYRRAAPPPSRRPLARPEARVEWVARARHADDVGGPWREVAREAGPDEVLSSVGRVEFVEWTAVRVLSTSGRRALLAVRPDGSLWGVPTVADRDEDGPRGGPLPHACEALGYTGYAGDPKPFWRQTPNRDLLDFWERAPDPFWLLAAAMPASTAAVGGADPHRSLAFPLAARVTRALLDAHPANAVVALARRFDSWASADAPGVAEAEALATALADAGLGRAHLVVSARPSGNYWDDLTVARHGGGRTPGVSADLALRSLLAARTGEEHPLSNDRRETPAVQAQLEALADVVRAAAPLSAVLEHLEAREAAGAR